MRALRKQNGRRMRVHGGQSPVCDVCMHVCGRARGCDVNGWCMLGESRMHAGMDEQDRNRRQRWMKRDLISATERADL